jgi:epoxyqueuosine reductase
MPSDDRKPTPGEIAEAVKDRARALGFDLVGITSADPPTRRSLDAYRRWLDAGHNADMAHLAETAAVRGDPSALLPGAKSVICLAVNYWPHGKPPAEVREPPAGRPPLSATGRVAAYARGRDYHRVMKRRMWRVCDTLEELSARVSPDGRPAATKCCLDIHPVMERDYAMRAGLGWIAKNTLLLSAAVGSYTFLGEILTDFALPPDPPATDHCGTCTACLDACPTDALPAPWVLDARRCISYLTIERRDALTDEQRDLIGGHVFGCDICQDVCPFNRRAPATAWPEFAEPRAEMRSLAGLAELLSLDEPAFLARFGGTPLMRGRRRTVLRNACIALANAGDPTVLPALERAFGDPDPVIAEEARRAAERLRPGAGA